MKSMGKKKGKFKKILAELLETNFFSEWRTPSDVLKKLDQRGVTISGRTVGMVCTTLTKMCQDPTTGLERDEIPKERRKGQEKYMF